MSLATLDFFIFVAHRCSQTTFPRVMREARFSDRSPEYDVTSKVDAEVAHWTNFVKMLISGVAKWQSEQPTFLPGIVLEGSISKIRQRERR